MIRSNLDPDLDHYNRNVTSRSKLDRYQTRLTRVVSRKDLSNIHLNQMPGFNLKWNYDNHVEPWPKFVRETKTKLFVRFVDFQNIELLAKSKLIHKRYFLCTYRLVQLLTQYDSVTIWKTVRETREMNMLKNPKTECQSDKNVLVSNHYIEENIKTLEEKSRSHTKQNQKRIIDQDILETSAKIFTYLNFCPPFGILSLHEDLFMKAETRNILLALISILKKSKKAKRESAVVVFKKVMEMLGFNNYSAFENIIKEIQKNLQPGIYYQVSVQLCTEIKLLNLQQDPKVY